jgi:hypothetical protein
LLIVKFYFVMLHTLALWSYCWLSAVGARTGLDSSKTKIYFFGRWPDDPAFWLTFFFIFTSRSWYGPITPHSLTPEPGLSFNLLCFYGPTNWSVSWSKGQKPTSLRQILRALHTDQSVAEFLIKQDLREFRSWRQTNYYQQRLNNKPWTRQQAMMMQQNNTRKRSKNNQLISVLIKGTKTY